MPTLRHTLANIKAQHRTSQSSVFSAMTSPTPARVDPPPYPVPTFLPTALKLEGALDVYEPARAVFSRLMDFLGRKDLSDCSADEVHAFLSKQLPAMVSARSLFWLRNDPNNSLESPSRTFGLLQWLHVATPRRPPLRPLAFRRLRLAAPPSGSPSRWPGRGPRVACMAAQVPGTPKCPLFVFVDLFLLC